ncbi:MAG: hypothetical protein HKN87_10380 [Saprospiraceae bacterium]|nr:hypothetical protein [Saprospiraceae bacterium]
MIKFFRKIRQKLLSEYKLGKYLLYAIGEIILVVIGILIAVQINNQNIENKRKALEINILLEILNNLEDDLKQINDELYSDKVIMQADSIIIDQIRSRAPYNDDLGRHLRISEMFPHLDSKESGYRLLESKGIDLISEDSLRIRITDFYNRDYPYFRKYEKERVDIVQSIIKPYLTKHFYLEDYGKWPYTKRVPMQYERFLNDAELISILQTSSNLSLIMHQKGTFLKTQTKKLQRHIQAFLERTRD